MLNKREREHENYKKRRKSHRKHRPISTWPFFFLSSNELCVWWLDSWRQTGKQWWLLIWVTLVDGNWWKIIGLDFSCCCFKSPQPTLIIVSSPLAWASERMHSTLVMRTENYYNGNNKGDVSGCERDGCAGEKNNEWLKGKEIILYSSIQSWEFLDILWAKQKEITDGIFFLSILLCNFSQFSLNM
jgi:hypothetical protein